MATASGILGRLQGDHSRNQEATGSERMAHLFTLLGAEQDNARLAFKRASLMGTGELGTPSTEDDSLLDILNSSANSLFAGKGFDRRKVLDTIGKFNKTYATAEKTNKARREGIAEQLKVLQSSTNLRLQDPTRLATAFGANAAAGTM